jgi:hypothetical protein
MDLKREPDFEDRRRWWERVEPRAYWRLSLVVLCILAVAVGVQDGIEWLIAGLFVGCLLGWLLLVFVRWLQGPMR